jgi:hypothetical protein
LRLSTLFNGTNIIHKTTSVSRKTKYIIHNVKDFSVLYNNPVRSVIYEGWHFTHMWKALVWLHHVTKKGGLVHNTCLIPPRFIKVPVPCQDFASFYDFDIWFRNCSDIVVLLFFILSHKVVLLLPEHAEANITSHLYAMLIDCCIMELLKYSRK